jgi:hypothetical protein
VDLAVAQLAVVVVLGVLCMHQAHQLQLAHIPSSLVVVGRHRGTNYQVLAGLTHHLMALLQRVAVAAVILSLHRRVAPAKMEDPAAVARRITVVSSPVRAWLAKVTTAVPCRASQGQLVAAAQVLLAVIAARQTRAVSVESANHTALQVRPFFMVAAVVVAVIMASVAPVALVVVATVQILGGLPAA